MFNNTYIDPRQLKRELEGKHGGIIFRNVGGLGDAVMITPALPELRKKFGKDYKIIIATIPYCLPIFQNNPYVDYIINTELFDNDKEHIKNYYPDIDFYSLSDPCPSAEYEAKHEPNIKRSRQELFCGACKVPFRVANSGIFLTKEEIEEARKIIPFEQYAVVHCSTHSNTRDVPKYHIDAIISKLVKKGVGVALISHKWKSKVKDNPAVCDTTGLPLRTVIAIINNSIGLIGGDSMGVHVAGALGKPSYGIFGMTDPLMRMQYKRAKWYNGYKCVKGYCWYHPCIIRYCLKVINTKKLVDDFLDFCSWD